MIPVGIIGRSRKYTPTFGAENVLLSEASGVYSLSYNYIGTINESNKPPIGESVSISGTLNVGETLSASLVEFKSFNNKAEGTHLYQWYRADNKYQSNEALITGATSSGYTLTSNELNKYIRCEITPVEVGGTNNGSPVMSLYTEAVAAAITPPSITSAIVNAGATNDWIITFDKAVTGSSSGYTLNIDGTGTTITGSSGFGTTTVTFSTADSVDTGSTLTLDYSQESGDTYELTLTYELSGVTGYSVTNNTTGATAPVIESVTTTIEGTSTTTFTFNMPSTRPDGDLYLLFYVKDDNPDVTLSGWTETLVGTGNANDFVLARCYYRIGSSEPATYQGDFPMDSETYIASVIRISNFNATTPINASGVTNQAPTLSPTTPSVNTTTDACLVFSVLGGSENTASTFPRYSALPATELFEYSSNDSGGTSGACALACTYATQIFSGSTGGETFTYNDSGAFAEHVGMTVAIAPAPI